MLRWIRAGGRRGRRSLGRQWLVRQWLVGQWLVRQRLEGGVGAARAQRRGGGLGPVLRWIRAGWRRGRRSPGGQWLVRQWLEGGVGAGGQLLGAGGGLALIGFQNLRAALFERVAPTELGHCLVGIGAILRAFLVEVVDHLGCQRVGALDGGVLDRFADAGGAECGIPVGMEIGGADVELVAGEVRAHRGGVAVRALLVVEIELIVGSRPAEGAADVLIARPAHKHIAVAAMDVGDVGGLPPKVEVFLNRQAVAPNRAGKVGDGDEVEPSGADAEAGFNGGVPGAVAPAEGFRGQGCPADVAAAFPPAHPSRCPLVAGHPNPAATAQLGPASVVVAGPAERFVGEPGPALVGAGPTPIPVGTPAHRADDRRLPDVAIVGCLKPGSVIGQ